MYSVRAELLRRMLNNKQEIDLETLACVYKCKLSGLRGVLLCFNLPVLECYDFRFKNVLRKQINRFEDLTNLFKCSTFNKDVLVSQCWMLKRICPELFDYCDFSFGNDSVYINYILPNFIKHLELVTSELKLNLVGFNQTMLVNQPNRDDLNRIGFYSSYLGDSLNLSYLLDFLDEIDQRAFLNDFCRWINHNHKMFDLTQAEAIYYYLASNKVKVSGKFSKITL